MRIELFRPTELDLGGPIRRIAPPHRPIQFAIMVHFYFCSRLACTPTSNTVRLALILDFSRPVQSKNFICDRDLLVESKSSICPMSEKNTHSCFFKRKHEENNNSEISYSNLQSQVYVRPASQVSVTAGGLKPCGTKL
jgi:hypothetical protein